MSEASKKSPAPAKAKKKAAKAPAKKKKSGPVAPDTMPADVVEFINAIDEYKRKNQRPFPSWSEVLEIVKTLGYSRTA